MKAELVFLVDSLLPADRWLRASTGLTLRACDEGVLVFDEKNGKTSLLNHQGALALRALCAESGVKAGALEQGLGMDNENDRAAFQAMISSLAEAGLLVS